jgi:hypothetical protein
MSEETQPKTLSPDSPEEATAFAIIVFRTQAASRTTWIRFDLILLDGSSWASSADTAVLSAAIRRHGIAGTIGVDKISDTETERIVTSWIEPATPEVKRALAKAVIDLGPLPGAPVN